MAKFMFTLRGAVGDAKWKNLWDSHKYRRIYGKRETFKNHAMKYPQVNYTMNGVKVLITEDAKIKVLPEI